jgi:hypothetical protein
MGAPVTEGTVDGDTHRPRTISNTLAAACRIGRFLCRASILSEKGLLFSVLLGMSLHCLFSVASVWAWCAAFFVMSALVVFGRLRVMTSGMSKML